MLGACRSRAEADGFASRCRFHHSFLDTLPADTPYQAATCFLVSQFIVDRAERVRFFAGIAARLAGRGLLTSTDLAADTASPAYATLLPAQPFQRDIDPDPSPITEAVDDGPCRIGDRNLDAFDTIVLNALLEGRAAEAHEIDDRWSMRGRHAERSIAIHTADGICSVSSWNCRANTRQITPLGMSVTASARARRASVGPSASW